MSLTVVELPSVHALTTNLLMATRIPCSLCIGQDNMSYLPSDKTGLFHCIVIISTNPFPTFLKSSYHRTRQICVSRFVFDGMNLAELKSKTRSSTSGSQPTRFEIVAALLWKCVAKSAYKANTVSLEKPFNFRMIINLGGKKDVPRNFVGNLIWPWLSQCKLATDLEHHYLVNQIKNSKAQINNDFVQVIQGDAGTRTVLQCADMMMNSEETSVAIWIITMCNMGVYELDFGWGKPVWFYYDNVNVASFITLCETSVGGGAEPVDVLSFD